jgi:hypothetical protein
VSKNRGQAPMKANEQPHNSASARKLANHDLGVAAVAVAGARIPVGETVTGSRWPFMAKV